MKPSERPWYDYEEWLLTNMANTFCGVECPKISDEGMRLNLFLLSCELYLKKEDRNCLLTFDNPDTLPRSPSEGQIIVSMSKNHIFINQTVDWRMVIYDHDMKYHAVKSEDDARLLLSFIGVFVKFRKWRDHPVSITSEMLKHCEDYGMDLIKDRYIGADGAKRFMDDLDRVFSEYNADVYSDGNMRRYNIEQIDKCLKDPSIVLSPITLAFVYGDAVEGVDFGGYPKIFDEFMTIVGNMRKDK